MSLRFKSKGLNKNRREDLVKLTFVFQVVENFLLNSCESYSDDFYLN